MVVQQVFLSPNKYQMIVFGKLKALKMLQHLFRLYVDIYEINLKGNPAKMMGPYEPTDPLDHLIEQP